MKKIAVVGYKGKMGWPIFLALEKKYDVFGVGRENSLEDLPKLDLVIDFASRESSVKSAEFCLKNNIPLVIGSTGQTDVENNRLDDISKCIPVIRKANFSQGIETSKRLIDDILKLKPIGVKISEKHHIHKKDKPSGTAIDLKNYIEKKFGCFVEIQSIREGEEMGEHKIKFCFEDEELVVQHNVLSRNAFVKGVVREVEKLI